MLSEFFSINLPILIAIFYSVSRIDEVHPINARRSTINKN